MTLTIPNILTLLRIALIPVLFIVFFLPYDWSRPLSCAIFIVATVTDWFDGYLARRLQQVSKFGAFVDPVADKLIVTVVLLLIIRDQPTFFVTLSASIIIGREIVISALREWLAELGKRAAVAVSYIGKVKTVFQMVALGLLLFGRPLFTLPSNEIGLALLGLAAFLTVVSMIAYLRAAWPIINH